MKRKVLLLMGSILAIALIAGGLVWAENKPGKAQEIIVPEGEEEMQPPAVGVVAAPFDDEERGTFAFFGPGRPGGGRLGVRLSEVTAEKAKELKLPGEYGAIVKEVDEDSPAAKGGLAKEDVILEFAGEKVRGAAHLARLVRETPPGRSVTLLISRAGKTQTLTATLEEARARVFNLPAPRPMPEINVPEFNFGFQWVGRGTRLGISADELTPQLAEYFGVKQGKGILVREVVVGSAAAKAGLKAGDVIIRVDDQEVSSVSRLRRALGREPEEKRKVNLTIVRDKREQTLPVELEPPERISPRHITMLKHWPEFEEEAQELAAEYAAHAKELAAEAMKAKHEWQKEQHRLQEELRRLQDEQRKMREEIKRQMRSVEQEVPGRVV